MDADKWPERIGLTDEEVNDPFFRQAYPFSPRFLPVQGGRMHYLDEGAGEPVVMLHGNPTWSFFYRNLILALRGSNRCLAPDHLGCGFSDKPRDFPYTLTHHIDNLEKWLDAVVPPPGNTGAPGDGDGRFNLIVHDWGGPIGMGYAARHPERVKRVVLLNTSAFSVGSMPVRIRLCRVPGLGTVLVRGLNLFAGLATLLTTRDALPGRIRKFYVMPYNSFANRIAVQRFVQDIPLKHTGPTYECFRDTEKRLPAALAGKPLLVQWGRRDWCFTPFFLTLWKERFPSAQVDEYDAGHYLLEDEGAAIAARIKRFLEG